VAAAVATALAGAAHASFPGAAGPILFTGDDRGTLDLYSVGADGSGVRQLTSDPQAEWSPSASPDGRRIAFTRDTGETCGHVFYAQGDEIYVMDADGSGVTRLTDNCPHADYEPAWSPSGQRLAFVHDGDIWTMKADGTDRVALTCTDEYGDSEPDWSPDGSLIAFVREGQVLVMRPDGTGVRQVTSGPRFAAGPSFSPDGARIAFTRNATTADEGLFVVGVDGAGLRHLDASLDWAPAWSPDGSAIVFDSNRDHPREATQALYAIDANGGEPATVLAALDAAGADWAPAEGTAVSGSEPDVTPADTACPESPATSSAPEPPVSPPTPGAVRAADVVAPDRLRVDRVSFAPSVVRPRRSVALRLRIVDETAGIPVVGAAVAVTSVPSGLVAAPPQQLTDTSGSTTVRLRPSPRLRPRRGRLVLAVHVRTPGTPWTGGASGLRLVSVRTAAR
jgi:TolB protein